MPKKPMEGALEPRKDPRLSLDFFVQARNGKKRNYVFDFHKSRTCAHSRLTALSIGGNWYRCEECNYAFDIVAAYQQPLHNLILGGVLNALSFSKEFGAFALQEVLRTPIGQYDKSNHKPALPEGMSFTDAVMALEGVDIHAEDGGKAQLQQVLERFWVSEKERERRAKELGAGDGASRGQLPGGDKDSGGGEVPALSEGAGQAVPQGDSGRP